MSNQLTKIFRNAIGPTLPQDLSPFVGNLLRPHIAHLKHATNQIMEQNPAFIEGIYVDLVDDFTINAAAYAHGLHEIVGINAGVAIKLPLIFYLLLSHPNVFPDIGDPSKETIPGPLEVSALTMGGKLSTLTPETFLLPAVVPKDSARAHYAVYMSVVAWDFLVFHELAHINRCHLPFLSKTAGETQPLSVWHEFQKQRREKNARIKRILEVDADGVAGRVLAGAPAMMGLENMRLIAFGPNDIGKDAWGWPRAYEIWLRSIGLLFSLMAVMDAHQNFDEPLRTHPHADVRIQLLINFIWPNWSKLIPDRAYFLELTNKTSSMISDIFRLGVLPTPSNLIVESQRAKFAETVQDQWESVHSVAKELNTLTEARWSQVRTGFSKDK